MLLELLLRDLSLHRRVLLLATVIPIFFLAGLAISPAGKDTGLPALLLTFGLLILSLLPVSLHLRERMVGTLGDLLALPVSRTHIVRLRFLEGVLACALFLAAFLPCWILPHHPPLKDILDLFRSPFLLWVLVAFLAYPMPFAFRWGGRGVGAAFALLVTGFVLWAFVAVRGPDYPWLRLLLQAQHGLERVSGTKAGTWGLPVLLLAGFHALAVQALKRVDA